VVNCAFACRFTYNTQKPKTRTYLSTFPRSKGIVWRAAPNAFLGERGPSTILLTNRCVVNCAFVCLCTYNAHKLKTAHLFITVHTIEGHCTGGGRAAGKIDESMMKNKSTVCLHTSKPVKTDRGELSIRVLENHVFLDPEIDRSIAARDVLNRRCRTAASPNSFIIGALCQEF
jgi:hypothetical protein